MSSLAYLGFWTCAALYAAVGVIGLVLLDAQPNITDAGDGYAIRIVAQK
jgi:hypothetical protein